MTDDERARMTPPPELVRGCDSPEGLHVLADWLDDHGGDGSELREQTRDVAEMPAGGYGDGDHSGFGSGNGYGYGDSYGDGDGDGIGDAYGDGDGDGRGDGDPRGDGDGLGGGTGHGYRFGYGFGRPDGDGGLGAPRYHPHDPGEGRR